LRRGVIELKIDILRNAFEPINITNLFYATRLSYLNCIGLAKSLVAKGFLTAIEQKDLERLKILHGNQLGAWPERPKAASKRIYYKTSKKGEEVLRLYDQIKALFEDSQ